MGNERLSSDYNLGRRVPNFYFDRTKKKWPDIITFEGQEFSWCSGNEETGNAQYLREMPGEPDRSDMISIDWRGEVFARMSVQKGQAKTKSSATPPPEGSRE